MFYEKEVYNPQTNETDWSLCFVSKHSERTFNKFLITRALHVMRE